MAGVPYRLDAQQWLLADQVMQEEASKSPNSRSPVSEVIKQIRKTSFLNAAKVPTGNAIKKRYETYFLGPGELDGSLVELADAMMDKAMFEGPKLGPSELAEAVKNTYFAKSPSALHTREAIEDWYRTDHLKWEEADEQMRFAARTTYSPGKKFRIGAVVYHVKQTFFSADPSTTTADIQDRYCKRWANIMNTPASVESYDDRRVAQEWSMPGKEATISRPENHSNTTMEPAQRDTSSPRPLVSLSSPENLPQNSSTPLQQHIVGPADLKVPPKPSPSPLSCDLHPPTPLSLKSYKRARRNSFDSNSSTSASTYVSQDSYTNFSRPQLQRFEMQLRDSGFYSSSSASDTTSLISRMSRLSVEVKRCVMDHTLMDSGNACPICRYPEPRPKPLVYVAPEYAAPQRADVIDADEMDNGIMTRNANARTG